MTLPNILLTRIDNRLVHGQVGMTWTSTIGANLLVVVDDVVASDNIQQVLFNLASPYFLFTFLRFQTHSENISQPCIRARNFSSNQRSASSLLRRLFQSRESVKAGTSSGTSANCNP